MLRDASFYQYDDRYNADCSSKAEVRRFHAVQRQNDRSRRTNGLASDGQLRLLATIAGERVVPQDALLRLFKRINESTITVEEFDVFKSWLKNQPRKGAQHGTAAGTHRASNEAAPVGVYELDGELYAIREAKGDDGQPFRFARLLVVTHDDDGGVHRVDFEKAPGAQYRVHNGRRLTVEEVEALSLDFKRCALCGRVLKVKESKQAGIGPRCRERIG